VSCCSFEVGVDPVGPDDDGVESEADGCSVGCVVGESTFKRSVEGSGGNAGEVGEFYKFGGSCRLE